MPFWEEEERNGGLLFCPWTHTKERPVRTHWEGTHLQVRERDFTRPYHAASLILENHICCLSSQLVLCYHSSLSWLEALGPVFVPMMTLVVNLTGHSLLSFFPICNLHGFPMVFGCVWCVHTHSYPVSTQTAHATFTKRPELDPI
jgi:hypothetical protein